MKNPENILDFKLEIEDNIGLAYYLLDYPHEYPYLHKAVMAHNGAIFDKLINLLEYTADQNVWVDFETGKRDHIVTDTRKYKGGKWRGWEVRISYDDMIAQWGGSFNSWKHAIKYLAAVGLIYPWYPAHHDKTENTPAQMNSLTRAQTLSKATGRKHKPVTWYGFPRYKGWTLDTAEERAELLSELTLDGISEDSVREALGNNAEAARIAQRAFDSTSRGVIFETTKKRRQVLRDVCLELIEANGYAQKDNVLEVAFKRYCEMDDVEWPDMLDDQAWHVFKHDHPLYFNGTERKRFELTWDAYRPTLKREEHLKMGRPTKSEYDDLKLPDHKTIIRFDEKSRAV